MQTEDMGRCFNCDMRFTEYDTPSFEVEHARWGSGFIHEDCLDDTVTIIERID